MLSLLTAEGPEAAGEAEVRRILLTEELLSRALAAWLAQQHLRSKDTQLKGYLVPLSILVSSFLLAVTCSRRSYHGGTSH